MRKIVLHLAAPLAVALLYSLWSARPLWSDVALTLVLALAVRCTWRARPVPLARPALAFAAAYALSAAFSADPLTSWRAVLGVVAYGLLYLLVGNLLTLGVRRAALYRALVLTAQVLVIAAAAGWLLDGAPLVGYRLRVENVNSFALVNLLLMPALLVGELRGLVIVEALAVAWLSASRSGAAGLVAGLASIATSGAGRSSAARVPRWLLAALGLVLVLGLAARADLLLSNGRSEMWAVAARMFADSPLVGQGPDTFKAHWLAGGPRTHAFGHAHNLYLNLAAETGALGLAAGAWLVGAVLHALSRAGSIGSKRGSMSGSMWSAAALAATVSLLALSIGDVPTTAPYITATWLALVACGLVPDEPA